MNEYLLDTNAILRYLLGDVPHQADEIKRLFLQAKDDKCRIYIPLVVIAEAVFVLTKTYGVSRQEITSQFLDFLSIPYISIEKTSLLQKVFSLFPSKNVSFVDLVLLEEAKALGKTIVTFDKKLKLASAKA